VLLLVCLPAGLMVGKALYEGILINMSFAPCFLLSLQVSCCWIGMLGTLLDCHKLDGRHKWHNLARG
jgi:hypothetical protein